MKRFIYFFSAVFFLSGAAFAQDGLFSHFQEAKPATVKVLLQKNVEKVFLEVQGKYVIQNIDTDSAITAIRSDRKAFLFATDDIINWNEEITFIPDLRIVPANAESQILLDGIEYKGCLEIHNHNGKLTLINEVDVENFLKATLPFKFTENLEPEVWQAVAIAERTSLYFLCQKKPNASWHFKAEDVDYQGVGTTFQDTDCENAIQATRYAVLTYQNKLFPALVTNDSGGKTSDFSSIFRKKIDAPAGVIIPANYRKDIDSTWSFQISKSELEKLFEIQDIQGIDLFSDRKSDKIYALRLRSPSSSKEIDFFSLQKTFGDTKLRSSSFTIELSGENVLFKGSGIGHGVGLCLSSSNIMAKYGVKAPKILSSFFPNAQVKKMRKASQE
jgi:stage II sporulation protein D